MVFCACSRCHLCRVFGSFFLLMNWWIISFTPCPLVVRKIADHFARQGGGGGGVMGWVIRDPRIIWWGGGGVFGPHGSVIRGPPTTRLTD